MSAEYGGERCVICGVDTGADFRFFLLSRFSPIRTKPGHPVRACQTFNQFHRALNTSFLCPSFYHNPQTSHNPHPTQPGLAFLHTPVAQSTAIEAAHKALSEEQRGKHAL